MLKNAIKSNFLNVYFIFEITSYILHQFLQKKGFKNVFIDSFWDDLVALPVCLSICVFLIQISSKNIHYRLKIQHIIFTAIVFSIVFEVVTPSYSNNSIASIGDVICYFIGGIFYFYFQNPKPNKNFFKQL